MKPAPDYHALVGAPIPRDPAVVMPYVQRANGWIRNTVWIFVALFASLALLVSILDISSGRTDAIWKSFAKGFAYTFGFGLFILGPVLLFWSVNRSNLRKLATRGQLLPAHVSALDVMHIRGNRVHMATVSFNDVTGQPRQAKFQGPDAEKLAVGNAVHVLQERGTSVAVIWPPDVLMLARIS